MSSRTGTRVSSSLRLKDAGDVGDPSLWGKAPKRTHGFPLAISTFVLARLK